MDDHKEPRVTERALAEQIDYLISNWFGSDGFTGLFNPERLRAFAIACSSLTRQAAPEAPTLPNGWKLEEGGDDIRLMRADGKWCGYSPDIDSPAHRLTLEFLRDLIAPQAATTASASQEAAPLTRCAAGRDGDCNHPQCPQARDGEPHKSQRHCPLDTLEDDE